MISSFVRALISAFKARRELALDNVALRVVSKNRNELKTCISRSVSDEQREMTVDAISARR